MPFNFDVNAWIYIDGGHVLGGFGAYIIKRHGCSVWLYMYAECDIALFLQKKRKKYSKKKKKTKRKKEKKSSDESVGIKQRNL